MNQSRPFAMILFLTTLIALLSSTHLHAQEVHKSTVYLEASTRGPSYSLNYDRVFRYGEKISWAYRIGAHWLHDEVGLPLGISLITGKQEHHVEISLTLTPYVDRANYLFREGNISDKYLYITPGVGYRYQRPTGGLFIRGLVAPLIFLDPPSDDFWNMDGKVYPLLSVGAGFTF